MMKMTQEEKDEALREAIRGGNLERVKALEEAGADVKHMNFYGFTPLHCAASNGCKEIAAFLLSAGADIHVKCKQGATPLHEAAQGGHEEVAEFLLSAGADIHAVDNNGNTPLHKAAWYGRRKVMALLLAKRAMAGSANCDGNQPLHLAACQGNKGIVDLLLGYGADPTAPGNGDKTPGAMCSDKEIRGLLEAAELEWNDPVRQEMRKRRGMAEHLRRQRHLGSLRPKAPAL